MNEPQHVTTCWCGNRDLVAFGGGYAQCRSCGSLVTLFRIPADIGQVRDDEHDFYGKSYWLAHQTGDLKTPDIFARSRSDLTERTLHWLRSLLALRPPPARVLDVGCSHGGFVAQLRLCGYDAHGLEISPWVVEYARRTFAIPMLQGPLEEADIDAGQFDVIVMTDVLEHLADPETTLRACARALAKDGVMLVQTPSFDPGKDHATLTRDRQPFLDMMMPDEHLFLFSPASARQLLERCGLPHVALLPAIFEHYDMYLAASREPLVPASEEQWTSALLSTPGGRMVLAMLDLRERELAANQRAVAFEADSSARLQQIETLTAMVRACETARAEQGQQIAALQAQLNSPRGFAGLSALLGKKPEP